jgi:methyl-accepting chemotaxis protein
MAWSNLSVGRKLWFCTGTTILFVTGFLVVVQYALSWTASSFSQLIDGELAMIEHGNAAKIAFLEARRNEKDTLYNDDESLVKTIVAFSSKTIEEARLIEGLATQTHDPALIGLSAALLKNGTDYQNLFRTAVAAPIGQPRMMAVIPMRKAAGEVEKQLNALLEGADQRIHSVRTDTEQRVRVLAGAVLILGLLAIALGAGSAILLGLGLTRPLKALHNRIVSLGKGDMRSDVPFASRRDEIGKMAAAVHVFKDSMIETGRLRAEQQAEQQRQLDRAKRVETSVVSFEKAVGQVLGNVTSSSTELEATANSMAATAEEMSRQSTAVAAASEEATTNVQTVSSATEELSSSIREITKQVEESTRIVGDSSRQATETNMRVRRLKESVEKIDTVVNLINNIASQTNLLALNATIEAARAGESGKGFAVVASEVKALATQTAKATEEIAGQIRGIQDETDLSVQAIQAITNTIGQVNTIATSIATAVEQQGSATQEIARSIAQAAHGTSEVSSNITSVSEASKQTGVAASQVLSAAKELSINGVTLRTQVENFLREVRAA